MNPYVSVGLAMCIIVLVSLVATGYMAAYFNRRAKADLTAALMPMANVIDGTVDIEEATVAGRYSGHIAGGRVAQLPGGMGRVFHIHVIDGAGGLPWTWTLSRSNEAGGADSAAVEGAEGALAERLDPLWRRLAREPTLAQTWFRVEYDPAAGHIRLTRPMRTRRDLPSAEAFQSYLTALVEIADVNRAVQHGPS